MKQIAIRRRLLGLLAGLAALVAIGVGFGLHEAQGRGVGLGTGIFSTGSCVAGFDRIAPSLCSRTTAIITPTTVNTTCTTVDLAGSLGINSTARQVELILAVGVISGTSVGFEAVALTLYSDSGCTVKLPTNTGPSLSFSDLYVEAYSPITSAGIGLGSVGGVSVAVINGQTTIYARRNQTIVAGGSTTASVVAAPRYYD